MRNLIRVLVLVERENLVIESTSKMEENNFSMKQCWFERLFVCGSELLLTMEQPKLINLIES